MKTNLLAALTAAALLSAAGQATVRTEDCTGHFE
jgi:hypothetical protein